MLTRRCIRLERHALSGSGRRRKHIIGLVAQRTHQPMSGFACTNGKCIQRAAALHAMSNSSYMTRAARTAWKAASESVGYNRSALETLRESRCPPLDFQKLMQGRDLQATCPSCVVNRLKLSRARPRSTSCKQELQESLAWTARRDAAEVLIDELAASAFRSWRRISDYRCCGPAAAIYCLAASVTH